MCSFICLFDSHVILYHLGKCSDKYLIELTCVQYVHVLRSDHSTSCSFSVCFCVRLFALSFFSLDCFPLIKYFVFVVTGC